MKTSQTYRRGKERKALEHLADSSSDIQDYRARLCYVAFLRKHPKWDKSFVKALAENKAMFVTLFQKPLEYLSGRRMERRLRKVVNNHNKKKN